MSFFYKRWIVAVSIGVVCLTQYYYLLIFVPNTAAEGTTAAPRDNVSYAAPTRVVLSSINHTTLANATNNKLYYVGQFGLGHRLSKLSAAFHLGSHVCSNVAELEVHWGSCKTSQTDLFTFLFGTHVLPLHSTKIDPTQTSTNDENEMYPDAAFRQGKTILVRNDVHGYYAGQSYKNAQVPIPQHYYNSNNTIFSTSPWLQKMQTDEQFFQDLLHRFVELHPAVRDFQNQHSWYNRTVIGLHLRAGNGEQNHFVQAGRETSSTVLVQNLCTLLQHQYWPQQQTQRMATTNSSSRLGPLLFVATDTPDLIPVVQESCRDVFARSSAVETSIVVFPQTRLEPRQGVSYSAWKSGQACFEGWLASMMDMALLSMSNIVIAGMRSTFTQIMPLSLVLADAPNEAPPGSDDDKRPKQQQQSRNQFCEVSQTGQTMTCFRTKVAWLFRNQEQQQDTFTTTTLEDSRRPVMHKVMVHLPDLQWSTRTLEMLDFLQNATAMHGRVVYGTRIDQTYRRRPNANTFREEWTFSGGGYKGKPNNNSIT